MLDVNLNWINVNSKFSELLGIDEIFLKKETIIDLVIQNEKQDFQFQMDMVRMGIQDEISGKFLFRKRNCEMIPLEIIARAVTNDAGEVDHCLLMIKEALS